MLARRIGGVLERSKRSALTTKTIPTLLYVLQPTPLRRKPYIVRENSLWRRATAFEQLEPCLSVCPALKLGDCQPRKYNLVLFESGIKTSTLE